MHPVLRVAFPVLLCGIAATMLLADHKSPMEVPARAASPKELDCPSLISVVRNMDSLTRQIVAQQQLIENLKKKKRPR